MSKVTRIHIDKPSRRIHFIPEWASKNGMKAAAIARETGADKGLVSRWWKGSVPSDEYLDKLAALFDIDVHDIFRDPADDWMYRLLRGKTAEEKEKIKATLEFHFPNKVA